MDVIEIATKHRDRLNDDLQVFLSEVEPVHEMSAIYLVIA